MTLFSCIKDGESGVEWLWFDTMWAALAVFLLVPVMNELQQEFCVFVSCGAASPGPHTCEASPLPLSYPLPLF